MLYIAVLFWGVWLNLSSGWYCMLYYLPVLGCPVLDAFDFIWSEYSGYRGLSERWDIVRGLKSISRGVGQLLKLLPTGNRGLTRPPARPPKTHWIALGASIPSSRLQWKGEWCGHARREVVRITGLIDTAAGRTSLHVFLVAAWLQCSARIRQRTLDCCHFWVRRMPCTTTPLGEEDHGLVDGFQLAKQTTQKRHTLVSGSEFAIRTAVTARKQDCRLIISRFLSSLVSKNIWFA